MIHTDPHIIDAFGAMTERCYQAEEERDELKAQCEFNERAYLAARKEWEQRILECRELTELLADVWVIASRGERPSAQLQARVVRALAGESGRL